MVTRLPSHQKNTPLKYDTFSEAHLAQKLCAMMAVKFCGMLKCICGQAETEYAAKKRRNKVKQYVENPKIIANKRRKKLDFSKQPPVSKNLRTGDAKSASYGRSKLAARAGSLALQVRLDPLEKVLSDLEGHRSGAVVVRHDLVTSIFLHFVIFDEQVGDVLCGGQARLLSGLADVLVQLQGQLRTKITSRWHGVVLLSADCNASIAERN